MELKLNSAAEARFENYRLNGLLIRKFDSLTNEPLPGAKFRVDVKGGSLIDEYTTDESGEIAIEGLEPGWYTITEISAPHGYINDDPVRDVEFKQGQFTIVEFSNSRKSPLQIIKVDARTGEPLSGAKFRVTAVNGAFVTELTTDRFGFAAAENLDPGWYVVTETQAPEGYVIDTAPRNIEVRANIPAFIEFVNSRLSVLQIQKRDADTGTPLAGASFRVTTTEGTLIGEYVTGFDGFINIPGLSPGSYIVTEIIAPDGYQIDSVPRTVVLHADSTAYVEFRNNKLPGLHVRKVDAASAEPLPGARFRVEKMNGELVGDYTTNSAGFFVIPGLAAGWYSAYELQAPAGYIHDPTPQNVELKPNSTAVLEFQNKPLAGLRIRKIDSQNLEPLAGARFRVSHKNGLLVGEYMTDMQGNVTIGSLQPGWYTIEEIAAPGGYQIEPPRDVELTWGQYTVVEFVNDRLPGLQVRKADTATGAPLAGVRFRVEKMNGERVGDFTTNSAGYFVIPDLPAGWYIVYETQSIDGYIKDPTPRNVELNVNGTAVVDFVNHRLPGLHVRKTDADTGEPIPGVRFRVEKMNGERVGDYTTNSAGLFNVSDLAAGWYTVYETQSIEGYILDSTPQSVELKANSTAVLEFRNKKLPGLQVRKVDAVTGAPLSGARFRVETIGGERVGDFTTNAAGFFVITDLPAGWYTAYELQAPAGYVKDATPQNIQLRANSTAFVEFQNKPLGSLRIRKVAEQTFEQLSGARFRVSHRSGEVVGSYMTDTTGGIVISGLEPGWYVVEETDPPEGYQADVMPKDVEVRWGQTANVEFTNRRLPGLQVRKTDAATGEPLPGVRFRVDKMNGERVGDYTTNSAGLFNATNLAAGWYTVYELQTIEGYIKDATLQNVELKPNGTAVLEFQNRKLSGLQVRKTDTNTGAPLPGAKFRVEKMNGERLGDFTTNTAGFFVLTDLTAGWYTVYEIQAPAGYVKDSTPQNVEIKENGSTAVVEFENRPLAGLFIRKVDNQTHQPLSGAKFRVSYRNGGIVGEYTTDAQGNIAIENLEPGWYTVLETAAPDGYQIEAAPRDVDLRLGQTVSVELVNNRLPGLQVQKADAVTGAPISGARFRVERTSGQSLSGSSIIGDYVTNSAGFFAALNLTPGWYLVYETQAPAGYIKDSTPQSVELKVNGTAVVEFLNKPLASLSIRKLDGQTLEPLGRAKFRVSHKGGALIGEYFTDAQGGIIIDGLEPGWYTIEETAAPDGYVLDRTPRDVELRWGQTANMDFMNDRLPGLQVKKVDAITNNPLAGAAFRVERHNGERVGDFTTNAAGFFVVTDLPVGWYTVYETKAPEGYIADATPQSVELKANGTAVLEFENRPLAGLQIRKVDDVTGLPLAGVEFSITELDGRRIGNFTTDANGLIFVPNLHEGYLIVAETKALPGYKPDSAPRVIQVKSGALNILEYRNYAYPFLQIKKVDAQSGAAIAGVKFKVYDQNTRELGEFTTNELGFIRLTGMEAGTYYIRETKAAEGYQLDDALKEVTAYWGKTTTIEVKNTPMASLKIRKADSVTGEPLSGAGFILYDAKNNVIGEYVSDANGMIVFGGSLPAGRYSLKEVKAPDGYVLPDQPVAVELKAGATTEISIPNDPMRGTIQIVKKAGSNNDITKHKAGAALAGAVFEVVNEKLEVANTITTDSRGIATTKDLPLGKYAIREIKAPDFYLLDGGVFYADIKLHGDVVRFEVLNEPADIAVTIDKRGNEQALTGDLIRYDFSNISNAGNIPLDGFYWRDTLPSDALRLEKLVTGTWSERLTYRVVYRTNLKSDYRVWQGNLLSTVSHELDVADLRLGAGEFVTEFRVEFGTVQPGFREKDAPYIMTRVPEGLAHEHRIVNKTDVGGKVGKEIVYQTDSWVTIAISKPRGKLPKTGLN